MKSLPKRKKKIVVDNHIKAYGEEEGGNIKINLRKHKGDKAEIADTLVHEEYHVKHPKATEKVTYKKTAQTMDNMSYGDKVKLVSKLRAKQNNYKKGAIKRKFGIDRHEKLEPGALIQRMNEQKVVRKTNQPNSSNFKLGVEALI